MDGHMDGHMTILDIHQQVLPNQGGIAMLTLPESLQPGAMNVKTHCKHGHSLDDAYLVEHRRVPGERLRVMRICRTCQIARAAWQRTQKRQR